MRLNQIDIASTCKTCPTSPLKSWRSRCRSTDVERTSQLLQLPSHLHVIPDGRMNLLQTSRDVGGRQQWPTRDAVVAVLVIFFDSKLVLSLQVSK